MKGWGMSEIFIIGQPSARCGVPELRPCIHRKWFCWRIDIFSATIITVDTPRIERYLFDSMRVQPAGGSVLSPSSRATDSSRSSWAAQIKYLTWNRAAWSYHFLFFIHGSSNQDYIISGAATSSLQSHACDFVNTSHYECCYTSYYWSTVNRSDI